MVVSGTYPEEIKRFVRLRLGLEGKDASKDEEINCLSPDAVLDHCCYWSGLPGWSPIIKRWIEAIYKVNLEVKE